MTLTGLMEQEVGKPDFSWRSYQDVRFHIV